MRTILAGLLALTVIFFIHTVWRKLLIEVYWQGCMDGVVEACDVSHNCVHAHEDFCWNQRDKLLQK
jgi:hypothetical protein